jgi:hypothetical protein
VEEIRSLGNTLARWCAEILAHHDTGASNDPPRRAEPVREEGQAVTAMASAPPSTHYRLRVLVHAGGVTWPPPAAAHPNGCSLLRLVEPVYLDPQPAEARVSSSLGEASPGGVCSHQHRVLDHAGPVVGW